MFVKNEVGNHCYVWTLGGGKGNRQSAAVLSAHGGQTILNSKCPKSLRGWVDLAFYCPHGYTLLDPSLLAVIEGRVKPNEVVPCGIYQDYSLSKYQTAKHGAADETYDAIAAVGKTSDEWANEGFRFDVGKGPEAPKLDIITIRYRRLKTDPTLFDILATMKDNGWTYDTIHCSFCRGPALKSEKGSWDAKRNA